MKQVGVVVIGRNEGERLKVCICSLSQFDLPIVYVDSGSSDDSVVFVKNKGFDVVELDMSVPFSAARARNEGYQYLLEKYPDIELIQFIDGDCEVYEGWISLASEYLKQSLSLAAVCGRRKERYPEATIYNQLCDIEWNTPVGPAASTGGDFLCRKQALVDVGGFSPHVIAGEEPELCFRMRKKGWKIERLNIDMTLHDAAMANIRQCWKRMERSGHAYAQGAYMHGLSTERFCVVDLVRIVLWALVIPLLAVFTLIFYGWFGALVICCVYPLNIIRLSINSLPGFPRKVRVSFATYLIFGKFPQLYGALKFFTKCFSGKRLEIIEYKDK